LPVIEKQREAGRKSEGGMTISFARLRRENFARREQTTIFAVVSQLTPH